MTNMMEYHGTTTHNTMHYSSVHANAETSNRTTDLVFRRQSSGFGPVQLETTTRLRNDRDIVPSEGIQQRNHRRTQ